MKFHSSCDNLLWKHLTIDPVSSFTASIYIDVNKYIFRIMEQKSSKNNGKTALEFGSNTDEKSHHFDIIVLEMYFQS